MKKRLGEEIENLARVMRSAGQPCHVFQVTAGNMLKEGKYTQLEARMANWRRMLNYPGTPNN